MIILKILRELTIRRYFWIVILIPLVPLLVFLWILILKCWLIILVVWLWVLLKLWSLPALRNFSWRILVLGQLLRKLLLILRNLILRLAIWIYAWLLILILIWLELLWSKGHWWAAPLLLLLVLILVRVETSLLLWSVLIGWILRLWIAKILWFILNISWLINICTFIWRASSLQYLFYILFILLILFQIIIYFLELRICKFTLLILIL